ncbi:putative fructose-bisphosphatase [Helianthus anomalus]
MSGGYLGPIRIHPLISLTFSITQSHLLIKHNNFTKPKQHKSKILATMAATTSSNLLHFSSSHSISRLSPLKTTLFTCSKRRSGSASAATATTVRVVRCMAVASEAESAKKTSSYHIMTLTNWLLKQEQSGVIDAELTIVLSSISMACKQIASLVQRASISNLTGVQGAVNVQGEDQKKLDVVSNEVC